jgi:hypothetical protein
MEIKELDKRLIEIANSNSFNGNRGSLRENAYKEYIETILKWDISENKKQTILNKLYDKNMELLRYESQHVSVMVAGPAKYNAKKLDKGDKILELSHNLCVWLEELEKQINDFKEETTSDDETKEILQGIKRLYELKLNPTNDIMKLAFVNNEVFIKTYEKYNEVFKWRKNSNIYKLYQQSLNGEIKEKRKEIFFEDENLTAFIEGDRAYIKFIMKPQRQLIVALKSRKWWWNSYKNAWSTYVEKLDKEWVSNISERYEKYI